MTKWKQRRIWKEASRILKFLRMGYEYGKKCEKCSAEDKSLSCKQTVKEFSDLISKRKYDKAYFEWTEKGLFLENRVNCQVYDANDNQCFGCVRNSFKSEHCPKREAAGLTVGSAVEKLVKVLKSG